MQKRLAARLEDDGYGRLIGREPNLTAEAAEKLYPNLKPKVRDAMIKAHNDVWEFGMKTGREKGIIIRKSTGKVLEQTEGEKSSVKLNLSGYKDDSLIIIHNHPKSNSFSVADMVTLNRNRAINTLAIQGQNGMSYTLRIGNGHRLDMKYPEVLKNILTIQFDRIIETTYVKDMSQNELSHRVVKEIADYYGWDYKRFF
ncbi:MAG: hypothetical protein RSD64_01550 [Christensenellaceae bacterium]